LLGLDALEEHIDILQQHLLFGRRQGIDFLHSAKQLQAKMGCVGFKWL
jgi:hypothetical protein